MTPLRASFLLMALLACGSALAHAHLMTSTPAEGSALASAPEAVTLTFSEPARITAAAVQKDPGPKHALRAADAAPAASVYMPLPALAPGAYSVTWRVIGADGHIVSGQLHFSIGAASPQTPHAQR